MTAPIPQPLLSLPHHAPRPANMIDDWSSDEERAPLPQVPRRALGEAVRGGRPHIRAADERYRPQAGTRRSVPNRINRDIHDDRSAPVRRSSNYRESTHSSYPSGQAVPYQYSNRPPPFLPQDNSFRHPNTFSPYNYSDPSAYLYGSHGVHAPPTGYYPHIPPPPSYPNLDSHDLDSVQLEFDRESWVMQEEALREEREAEEERQRRRTKRKLKKEAEMAKQKEKEEEEAHREKKRQQSIQEEVQRYVNDALQNRGLGSPLPAAIPQDRFPDPYATNRIETALRDIMGIMTIGPPTRNVYWPPPQEQGYYDPFQISPRYAGPNQLAMRVEGDRRMDDFRSLFTSLFQDRGLLRPSENDINGKLDNLIEIVSDLASQSRDGSVSGRTTVSSRPSPTSPVERPMSAPGFRSGVAGPTSDSYFTGNGIPPPVSEPGSVRGFQSPSASRTSFGHVERPNLSIPRRSDPQYAKEQLAAGSGSLLYDDRMRVANEYQSFRERSQNGQMAVEPQDSTIELPDDGNISPRHRSVQEASVHRGELPRTSNGRPVQNRSRWSMQDVRRPRGPPTDISATTTNTPRSILKGYSNEGKNISIPNTDPDGHRNRHAYVSRDTDYNLSDSEDQEPPPRIAQEYHLPGGMLHAPDPPAPGNA